MLNEELAIAMMREVRRQTAKSHRSEKAQQQAERSRSGPARSL